MSLGPRGRRRRACFFAEGKRSGNEQHRGGGSKPANGDLHGEDAFSARRSTCLMFTSKCGGQVAGARDRVRSALRQWWGARHPRRSRLADEDAEVGLRLAALLDRRDRDLGLEAHGVDGAGEAAVGLGEGASLNLYTA